jgi:hypothetical protein
MTASPYLDPGLSTPADADGPDDGGVVLQFADVGEFVDQLLVPTYRRLLTETRLWCARWWLHGEAIARLEGVWRAYERMRVEDEWTGVSAWQRDFLDYHLVCCRRRMGRSSCASTATSTWSRCRTRRGRRGCSPDPVPYGFPAGRCGRRGSGRQEGSEYMRHPPRGLLLAAVAGPVVLLGAGPAAADQAPADPTPTSRSDRGRDCGGGGHLR